MKSLYDNKFRYTEEANDLGNITYDALVEAFRHYVSSGFSPREVSHIIMNTVVEMELNSILNLDPHA